MEQIRLQAARLQSCNGLFGLSEDMPKQAKSIQNSAMVGTQQQLRNPQ
jgi:hypothetical protein